MDASGTRPAQSPDSAAQPPDTTNGADGTPDSPKTLLRARLRAARRQRCAGDREAVATSLAERALEPGPLVDALAAAGTGAVDGAVDGAGAGRVAPRVALYASRATEPGTAPLIEALERAGVVVLLPVVRPDVAAGNGRVPAPLGWTVTPGGGARSKGARHGAPGAEGARVEDAHLTGVAAVLLPALAVDVRGTRIGQGGGHYDTTLAALGWDRPGPGRPLLAALVHEEEVLEAGVLVPEPHDVGVQAALTPGGWVLVDR